MQSFESALTLSALARKISSAIRQVFGQDRYWVIAEVIGIKISRGHCYLQLAEKDEFNITPKAEFRAICWATTFENIHSRFISETGGPLREQLQVLMNVEVQFHERFGLSLIVHDLDTSYTLGQLELERRKTVERLKLDGIYDLNRLRKLPDVIQKVAVISAEDSRGYEDFIKRVTENNYGYKFDVKLFPSLLQGDLASADIVSKLIAIYDQLPVQQFDAVLIVRGGGGASSLGCFNDFNLARAVARFPIPVISGIGHSSNKSVVDEVSNIAVITPTDAAVFLVNYNLKFETSILSIWNKMEDVINDELDTENDFIYNAVYHLSSIAKSIIKNENQYFDLRVQNFQSSVNNKISTESSQMKYNSFQLSTACNFISDSHSRELTVDSKKLVQYTNATFRYSDEKLKSMEDRVRLLDPSNVLKRGYSYTLKEDKIITGVSQLSPGDTIKTIFANGEIESSIINIKNG